MTALAATSRAGWTAALGGSLLLHAAAAAALLPLLEGAGRMARTTEISFSEPPPDVIASLPQRSETLAPTPRAAEAPAAATAGTALPPLGAEVLSAGLPPNERIEPGSPLDAAPERLAALPPATPGNVEQAEDLPPRGAGPAVEPAPAGIAAAAPPPLPAAAPAPGDALAAVRPAPAMAGLAAGSAVVPLSASPLAPEALSAPEVAPAQPPSPIEAAAPDAAAPALPPSISLDPAPQRNAPVEIPAGLLPQTIEAAAEVPALSPVAAAPPARPDAVAPLPALQASPPPQAEVAARSSTDELTPAPTVSQASASVLPPVTDLAEPLAAAAAPQGTFAREVIAPTTAPAEATGSGDAGASPPSEAPVLEPLPQQSEQIASAVQAAGSGGAASRGGTEERQARLRRQAVAFARAYEGGGNCFAVVPKAGNGDAIGFDAFSRDGRAMQRFAQAASALGNGTSTSFADLSAPQCYALVFARGQRNYPDFTLTISLESDRIPDHSTLAGRIIGAPREGADLLLIDDAGRVQALNSFLSAGSEPAFRIPVNLTDGQVRTKQLLMALTTDRPLRTLESEVDMAAPAFFHDLQAEIRVSGAKLDLALRAFNVEAEAAGPLPAIGEASP